MATKEELEKRLEKVENHMYNLESEDHSDDIGYLKRKLRDAGEEFEDMKDRMQDLNDKMDRMDSEEELYDDMKDLLRDVESEAEDAKEAIDDRLDTLDSLHSTTEKVVEDAEELVDNFDEKKEDLVYKLLLVSEHQSKFYINGYSNSSVLTDVFLRRYFPDCESADRFAEMMDNRHEYPAKYNKYISDMFDKWIMLVDEILEMEVDVPDPRNSPELFRSHIAMVHAVILMEHGDLEKNMIQEFYDDYEADVYDDMCDRFDLDPKKQLDILENSSGEELASHDSPMVHVQLYTQALSKSFNGEKMASEFFEFMEDQKNESITDSLAITGIDTGLIDEMDEEKLRGIKEEIRSEGDEDGE